MKVKDLILYCGLKTALTLLPLTNVNAEAPMREVMKRVENGRKISFTDLQQRDDALMHAYGHFLPFDRVNVTGDGKLIDLTDEVIDHIVNKSYPVSRTESVQLDSLLSNHKDFYIVGKDGSFRLLIEEPNLVGTTDNEVKTSFTDIGVNETTGNYFGRIARKTDRVATEAYQLYNNITSLKISLAGRKSSVLADLPNRFGIALNTNSSLADVKGLVEKSGIYSVLENALANVPNLGRNSKVTLNISTREEQSGNVLNYEIVIKDASKEYNRFQGILTEDQFWKNHKMTRPIEIVVDLETYLGVTPVAVAGITSEGIAVTKPEGTDTVKVTQEVPVYVEEKKEEKKAKRELPSAVNIFLGAGYNPIRGVAGMQFSIGDFVYDAYGGVSKTGNEHETVSSRVSSLGHKHEISKRWNEDGMGLLVGGDLGYRVSKNISVVAGVDVGASRVQTSGIATPRVYDKNGEVIGRNPDQVITDSNLRKRIGLNFGAQYKGVSGKYSYDVKGKKHGVEVTVPILRVVSGGKNE